MFIGHEGPGSVFALLKERGWATSLSAGTSGRYDIFEMFEVKLTLTDEGFGALSVSYKTSLST